MYGAFADVTPLRSHITIEDVAGTAVYLASPLSGQDNGRGDLRRRRFQHPGPARSGRIAPPRLGEVIYVDGGFNILGLPVADE